jgi:predicted Rossmann-fold nucleotide-binding protein
MDAANSAVQDLVGRESRSYGLPIDIPTLREPANTHLDVKSPHQRFSSRLDEFMRLSNAIIVAPGGIGTLLELVYVWQLLQVGLANDRPVILINRDVWNGLLIWMHEAMLLHGYVSPRDFRWITLVDDAQDVIELVSLAHDRYMRAQMEHATPGADVDRAVTRRVLTASPPPPVEHPEQDVA